MAGVAVGITWLGYWVMYYGITQIQSGNWGFLDLGLPGRWNAQVAATPRDDGTTLTPLEQAKKQGTKVVGQRGKVYPGAPVGTPGNTAQRGSNGLIQPR